VPGKIDYKTGKIEFGEMNSPEYDDVLDDLAKLVLLNNGSVFILEKDKMPGTTGIAANYRY
jgi:hypothetical protein